MSFQSCQKDDTISENYLFLIMGFSIGCGSTIPSELKIADDKFQGTIISLRHGARDICTFQIKDYASKDTLEYSLFVSSMMEENNVDIGDSIYKEAHTHRTYVFKKQNG